MPYITALQDIKLTRFQTPRGIRGYQLIGGDFDHWKIQGNLGGEDYPDKVRGPLNEGGLFVERAGSSPLSLCNGFLS